MYRVIRHGSVKARCSRRPSKGSALRSFRCIISQMIAKYASGSNICKHCVQGNLRTVRVIRGERSRIFSLSQYTAEPTSFSSICHKPGTSAGYLLEEALAQSTTNTQQEIDARIEACDPEDCVVKIQRSRAIMLRSADLSQNAPNKLLQLSSIMLRMLCTRPYAILIPT